MPPLPNIKSNGVILEPSYTKSVLGQFRATQLGKAMTDQEINLFYAKYLGFDKPKQINGFPVIRADIFSPATDANDRDLVFDKLIKDGWEIEYFYDDGYVFINACIDGDTNKTYTNAEGLIEELKCFDVLKAHEATLQEANRAILERIMNIINGSD